MDGVYCPSSACPGRWRLRRGSRERPQCGAVAAATRGEPLTFEDRRPNLVTVARVDAGLRADRSGTGHLLLPTPFRTTGPRLVVGTVDPAGDGGKRHVKPIAVSHLRIVATTVSGEFQIADLADSRRRGLGPFVTAPIAPSVQMRSRLAQGANH
jgi:hypothetical protein